MQKSFTKPFPKSTLGQYSVLLIILTPTLQYLGTKVFLNFYPNIPSGRTIPQDIIARPTVAIPMLLSFITGITSFALGLSAILCQKERSFLVFISTLLGFLLMLFLSAQLLFPR